VKITTILATLTIWMLFAGNIASGATPEKCHEFCESMKKIAWVSYVAATKGSKPVKIKQQAIRNNRKVDKDIVVLSVDKGLEMFYMSGNELLKNRSQSIAAIKTGCYLGCTNPEVFAGLSNPYSKNETVTENDEVSESEKQQQREYEASFKKEGIPNHKGRVVYTAITGRFAFSKIDENDKEVWVADYNTKIKVGDMIEFAYTPPMKNFESRALNMTFDEIYFSETTILK
jgi:hypothetical protein